MTVEHLVLYHKAREDFVTERTAADVFEQEI